MLAGTSLARRTNVLACLVLSRGGGLAEGLPGGVRHCQGQNATHPSHQARSRAQLFRILLRDYQLACESVSLSQTGLLTCIEIECELR